MSAKWKLAVAFLLGLTAFAACAQTGPVPPRRIVDRLEGAHGRDILVVVDSVRGVACYQNGAGFGGAISCVKVTP